MKKCNRCKVKQPLISFHKDKSKKDGVRTECKGCDNRNKGMREYQLIVTYFLVLDRIRGASYKELAEKYKLDKSNMSKRIRGVLNADKRKINNVKTGSNNLQSNCYNGSISSINVPFESR